MITKKIQDIIDYGYDFKFGTYISEGIDIFKEQAGLFIGFGFVAGMMTMIASSIPFIGSLISEIIVSPVLTAGVYLVAHRLVKRETVTFNDFFNGFEHVVPLALASLVGGLIVLLSFFPFLFANYQALIDAFHWFDEASFLLEDVPFPGMEPWSWILLALPIYVGIAYSWAPFFVIFYRYEFWDALEASRQLISKKWFIFLLFSLALGFIAMFGLIFFLIGILVTYPIVLCISYAAFSDVTRLDEEDKDMEISDHLVA